VKRALTIVGTLLIGMLGLFMSLCGGGLTVLSLSASGADGLLAITIPSLLLGVGLIWLCVRTLRRMPPEPDP
jgi:hypothetical protein